MPIPGLRRGSFWNLWSRAITHFPWRDRKPRVYDSVDEWEVVPAPSTSFEEPSYVSRGDRVRIALMTLLLIPICLSIVGLAILAWAALIIGGGVLLVRSLLRRKTVRSSSRSFSLTHRLSPKQRVANGYSVDTRPSPHNL